MLATSAALTENLKLADTNVACANFASHCVGQHSEQACINGALNINRSHVLASADVDAVVLRIAWNGAQVIQTPLPESHSIHPNLYLF